eukprot:9984620-Karenia_brevis.AAC.1
MAKNKAGDDRGIVIEMIQRGGPVLFDKLASLFTDILQGDPPEYWKQTKLKVLVKKGDPQDPANYRPIAMLPIMYKLFARVLCGRIGKLLDAWQPVDQAGFRSGFGCEDHLFTMSQLVEKHLEYQNPLWAAAVDFEKAFDSVEHDSIWEALVHMNVPANYVVLLSSLYSAQTGTVTTDKASRQFNICRGTKQGDPLSTHIFNAVLQHALREVIADWQVKGYGIRFGRRGGTALTNLRFADDVILVATSRKHVEIMLQDLSKSCRKVGLNVHHGKTKVICSIPDEHRRGSDTIQLDNQEVRILSFFESTSYLGRALAFGNSDERELTNRINCAWGKFMKYKHELCYKQYPLQQRLKLFDATVTPTVLYCSGTWTMTKSRRDRLRGAQRHMLRRMLGSGRK